MTTLQTSLRGLEESYLVDNIPSEVETQEEFTEERFGLFVFLVAGAAAMILILVMFLREYYWRKYGVDICPGTYHRTRPQDVTEQIDQDRELAQQLQRQLHDEQREVERQAKRKERRAWYETYIKPFTVVVRSENFFYAQDENDDDTKGTPQNTKTMRKMSTAEMTDDEIEEEADPELGIPVEDGTTPLTLSVEDDENSHLYVCIPVETKCGNSLTVDGQCAICVSEYEDGESIVWSALECKHAFHYECIMPWLVKGKKRCPICRHWFVPGARIEDQRKAFEERLRQESASSSSGLDSTTRTDVSNEEAARNDESPGKRERAETTETETSSLFLESSRTVGSQDSQDQPNYESPKNDRIDDEDQSSSEMAEGQDSIDHVIVAASESKGIEATATDSSETSSNGGGDDDDDNMNQSS